MKKKHSKIAEEKSALGNSPQSQNSIGKKPLYNPKIYVPKNAKKSDIIPNNPSLPLINKRHELFAQFLASGSEKHEAYLKVYDTEGAGRKGARQESLRLRKKEEIQARVSYLLSLKLNVQAMNKEQWLSDMANMARDTTKTEVSRLKAYEMYGKAQGFYNDAPANQTNVNIVSDATIQLMKERMAEFKKISQGRKYQIASDVSSAENKPKSDGDPKVIDNPDKPQNPP